MSPRQGGITSHGRKCSGSVRPTPSPLGRCRESISSQTPGSSNESTPVSLELDDDVASSRKRRWRSSVWIIIIYKKGKFFDEDDQEVNGLPAEFAKLHLNIDEEAILFGAFVIW
uniref:Uncharacterized protein n=1 Tax=Opuntia streptacantha TaxID=393608 RepID=A0A7C9AN35_OPUST